jgi:hypothetical protein
MAVVFFLCLVFVVKRYLVLVLSLFSCLMIPNCVGSGWQGDLRDESKSSFRVGSTDFFRRIRVTCGRNVVFSEVSRRQVSLRDWIPSSAEVFGSGCFSNCKSLSSVTFESGSRPQRIGESAFKWSGITHLMVPSSVEILCKECFRHCRSLTSITFESGSRLQRIEGSAFVQSVLKGIIIPKSVEVLCKECFCSCKSLTSITFESDSKLQRIEEFAFT